MADEVAGSNTEEWRRVVGFEGDYAVSNIGRIKRMSHACGAVAGRILKTPVLNTGYPSVAFYVGGRCRKRATIHSVVMAAFVGPRPPGHEVNHKDGDKLNARLDNLEYVTPRENSRHARDVGLAKIGSARSTAKLTEADIPVIREMLKTVSRPDVARHFGVARVTIRNVVVGKTWKHVP